MSEPFVTEQEKCWELGGEIMDQGLEHPALKAVMAELKELEMALADVQKQSKCLKKFGVGRTEDPTLIVARVVPQLRRLGEAAGLVADQLQARLRRG